MQSSANAMFSLVPFIPLDPVFERTVDRLLHCVSATTASSIAVAGPLAGPAMSALCRKGVERVEAARRITSPSADQFSQVLLLLGCVSVDQVVETLENMLPILAPGGMLGVDASRIAAVKERFRLCQMLSHRGLRYRPGMELRAEIIACKPAIFHF